MIINKGNYEDPNNLNTTKRTFLLLSQLISIHDCIDKLTHIWKMYSYELYFILKTKKLNFGTLVLGQCLLFWWAPRPTNKAAGNLAVYLPCTLLAHSYDIYYLLTTALFVRAWELSKIWRAFINSTSYIMIDNIIKNKFWKWLWQVMPDR